MQIHLRRAFQYFSFMILLFCLFQMGNGANAQSRISFDEQVFSDVVRSLAENKAMGYAFVVANRKGIVAKVSGGFARAPGDGNLKMKTYIPSNVGSVFKVISGIALLHLLEGKRISNSSVERQLDTPMEFFLPDKWRRTYIKNGDPRLGQITLRNLLNHRSRLAQEPSNAGTHGTIIARALSLGVTESAIGTGNIDYNNNNYTLLLYIIPAIAYPDAVDQIEKRYANLALSDYNRKIAPAYGALYERYIRQLLTQTLEPISPTCRPSQDIKDGRFAKEYSSRTSRRGTITTPEFCRSQGSWYFSTQDLAHFARTVEFSERFISNSTRDILTNPSNKEENLIFWRSVQHSDLGAERGLPDSYTGHGGGTAAGSRAAYVRLPYGYVGVAAATSSELTFLLNSGNDKGLAQIMLDAFYAATRKWKEYDTDRPGKDYDSLLLNRPDPSLCEKKCNGEARCKAWTYVKPGIQDTKAKCWLKTSAPAAYSNNCCASGVKGIEYRTDRPGADYRSTTLGRPDPALCQALCGLDAKCRAWTYVEPGKQDKNAKCWLKTGYPKSRRSDCCASGKRP